MQWDFTPEQIVKGQAEYRLEDFRRDLAHEVAMNVEHAGAEEFRRAFDAIYDQCYWLATGKPLTDLLATFDDDPPTRDLLAALESHLQANVEMLGAILQREIMDRVAQGHPLEHALQWVAARHDELVRTPPGAILPPG
jgi:hypothetical protein